MRSIQAENQQKIHKTETKKKDNSQRHIHKKKAAEDETNDERTNLSLQAKH